MTPRRRAPVLLLAAALLAPATARANDPAAAQVLFEEGKKLMAAERFAEACPKLEESERLDPAGGTLLHLALCREKEGRIATAWALYQDALAQAKRDNRRDRARAAQERIDSLGPKLPRLRVRVAAANRRAPGFAVTRDDLPVGEAQWGDAIPIDPGKHELRAKADNKKPWAYLVDVPPRPGELTVEIPELEPEPQTPSSAGAPAPSTTPRILEAKAGDGQRTLGLVTAGVGVAGLGLGTVFAILSKQKHDQADRECKPPDHTLCTQAGVDAGHAATTDGTVSTIAFVAGGLLVAGGAALYFTAPTGSVAIAPTAGGVLVSGRFQ